MPLELLTRATQFATSNNLLRSLGGRAGMLHVSIVFGAAAVLWAGLMVVNSIRTRRGELRQSSEGMFLELCAAHRLDRAERQTLLALAATLPAAECCRIFLDPQYLDDKSAAGGPDAAEYQRLADKLFGPQR
jgi:hypothetical protein